MTLYIHHDCRSKSTYADAKPGPCHFINGTKRAAVALASFPGSGNTWVRGLLEKATGVCTGEWVYVVATLDHIYLHMLLLSTIINVSLPASLSLSLNLSVCLSVPPSLSPSAFKVQYTVTRVSGRLE